MNETLIKKIQLSPVRIIPNVITVWNRPGPEVDIVMELHDLKFKKNSLDAIYSFHVVEHLFMNEIVGAVQNWTDMLEHQGELFIVTNDFDFIARSYVGGDILLEDINKKFTTPCQLTRDVLTDMLIVSGFYPNDIRVWYTDVTDLFKKEDYELIVAAKRYDTSKKA